MSLMKDHIDSIQFLKGRISILRQQIIKTKESTSSIDNSIEILELQYEIDRTETALNIVKASWQTEFNKLDNNIKEKV